MTINPLQITEDRKHGLIQIPNLSAEATSASSSAPADEQGEGSNAVPNSDILKQAAALFSALGELGDKGKLLNLFDDTWEQGAVLSSNLADQGMGAENNPVNLSANGSRQEDGKNGEKLAQGKSSINFKSGIFNSALITSTDPLTGDDGRGNTTIAVG